MHDPYAFRQLEYCKLWNRSGLFYPCLEDTRAGCDKCASKRKVSMHERSRKQSLSLEVTALLRVRGVFFCWQHEQTDHTGDREPQWDRVPESLWEIVSEPQKACTHLASSGRSGPRRAQLYQVGWLRASPSSWAKQMRSHHLQRWQRSVLAKRLSWW